MKLAYNILWIDDVQSWVKSMGKIISSHLDELGFKLNIDWHKDGKNIEKALKNPEIDLIAVDYKLPGINGDALISKIRGLDNFIEIVFYSMAINPVEVIGVMDGVYHAKREDAEGVLKKVIDVTLRTSQDINNMRGLVIAETIDIETQIEELIVQFFREKGTVVQNRVLDKDGPFDFKKKVDFLNSILKYIKKTHNMKAQQLIQDKKKDQADKLTEKVKLIESLKTKASKLEEEVVKPRNMLAHVETKIDVDGKHFIKSMKPGYSDIKCTQDWCKKMRSDLIKHSENLNEISKHI